MSMTVKSSEPTDDELSFRFVSGHRALDFATTFGDRYRSGVERLRQPADLDRRLRAAGISASTPASAEDLDDARQLREVIYRLARAVLHNEAVDGADLDALNAWARTARLAPQLDGRLCREWASSQPIKGALALIACEAIELLSGPERELIRECAAAPACSLLYLDRSRGRRRRWCQMERCGSRAKMAEYRKRRRASTEGPGVGDANSVARSRQSRAQGSRGLGPRISPESRALVRPGISTVPHGGDGAALPYSHSPTKRPRRLSGPTRPLRTSGGRLTGRRAYARSE